MTSGSPSRGLDLVVVGGLTVDRFIDGSSAPGGAVLHIARALAPRGVRVEIVTTAGPEPVAKAGLEELRAVADALDATSSAASITFGHVETAEGRELVLERRGGQVRADAVLAHGAILFAPVADEIPTASLRHGAGALRGAILQGWLRSTAEAQPVTAQRLASLDPVLVAALADLDLVIGSSEDLRADGSDALMQLQTLRIVLGDRPPLVVTDGANGPWLDDGAGPRHLPLGEPISGVSTIGAGDMFAAFMLLALSASGATNLTDAAETAMDQVADVLRSRQSGTA